MQCIKPSVLIEKINEYIKKKSEKHFNIKSLFELYKN